jgi:hypothetical protein
LKGLGKAVKFFFGKTFILPALLNLRNKFSVKFEGNFFTGRLLNKKSRLLFYHFTALPAYLELGETAREADKQGLPL